MVALDIAHSAHLNSAKRREVRSLLDSAYGGDFSDHDWEHGLGGMHVLLWEGPDLVGHGAVVQRCLICGGRPMRAGYIEAVAIRPDHRRQGFATIIMRELEHIIRSAYHLGALSASADGAALYRALGWTLWTGPSAVLTPDGVQRTEDDDGAIYVLPLNSGVETSSEIICDWRDGDVW
jgi:aminoglycoside 2'-N-acetyltransferase I